MRPRCPVEKDGIHLYAAARTDEQAAKLQCKYCSLRFVYDEPTDLEETEDEEFEF